MKPKLAALKPKQAGKPVSIVKAMTPKLAALKLSDLGSGSGSGSDPQNRSPSTSVNGYGRKGRKRFRPQVLDWTDCLTEFSTEVIEDEPGAKYECHYCGKIVKHHPEDCPYLRFVPHEAILPRGVSRFCNCCFLRDGHPGRTDWEGFVDYKVCDHCETIFEHWTDECPWQK